VWTPYLHVRKSGEDAGTSTAYNHEEAVSFAT
jgi:hypothetical protein